MMFNHCLHRYQRKALPTPSFRPKEGFANCHGSESTYGHLITIRYLFLRTSLHHHSRLPLFSTLLSMRIPSPKLREPSLNYHRQIEGHVSLLLYITCYIRRTQIRDTELNCVRKFCQHDSVERVGEPQKCRRRKSFLDEDEKREDKWVLHINQCQMVRGLDSTGLSPICLTKNWALCFKLIESHLGFLNRDLAGTYLHLRRLQCQE